jgi:hypothetical protein
VSGRPGFGGGGGGGAGPPGPAGPDSSVYWSPAGLGNAITDADVVALCADGPKVIHLIDGAAAIYNWGIVGDVKGSVFYAPTGDPGERFLIVSDGSKIRNVGRGQFDGDAFSGSMTVRFDNDTTVSLEWDGFPAPSFNNGAKVENIGLNAAIDLAAGPNSFLAFGLSGGATIGTCTSPILLTNGDSLIIFSKVFNGNGTMDVGWIDSQATDQLAVLSDGSFDFRLPATWPTNLATVLNNPAALNGGQGPTSQRPTTGIGSPLDGCVYANTDTGEQEIYNVAANAWQTNTPKGPRHGYSPVSRAVNGTTTVGLTAGDINAARVWCYDDLVVGQQCTGMRFYWPGGAGPLTVRARLYSDGGTVEQRSVDVAVDAAGVYDVVWGLPFSLSAGYAYNEMSVAMWETSGTWYAEVTAFNGVQEPSGTDGIWRASPGVWWHRSRQGAGNTDPVAGFGGTFLAMEPVVAIAAGLP